MKLLLASCGVVSGLEQAEGVIVGRCIDVIGVRHRAPIDGTRGGRGCPPRTDPSTALRVTGRAVHPLARIGKARRNYVKVIQRNGD